MARLAIVVSQLEPLHTPPSHSTTAALISTEDESDVSICIGNISQVCVCVCGWEEDIHHGIFKWLFPSNGLEGEANGAAAGATYCVTRKSVGRASVPQSQSRRQAGSPSPVRRIKPAQRRWQMRCGALLQNVQAQTFTYLFIYLPVFFFFFLYCRCRRRRSNLVLVYTGSPSVCKRDAPAVTGARGTGER